MTNPRVPRALFSAELYQTVGLRRDFDAVNAMMMKSDANRRWQAVMSEFLVTAPDPDGGPTQLMTEIFRLD